MSEWKEYKLGETCEITTGFTFKGDEYEPNGNLKVVRGENVTIGKLRWDAEKHWNNSTDGLEKYFLSELDIVIGMDGSRVGQNRAIIRREELPLILAQRVARLRAKKGFNQKFIWYHIFSNYFKDYVEAIHTGTSIPHISQSQIADFEITAPPETKQTAIAEVLSSLDDKIDLLHRQNKTLEQLAEALFRQWFVEEAEESWENTTLSEIAIHFKKSITPSNFSETVFKHYSIPAFDEGKEPKKEFGSEILSGKYQVLSNSTLISKLNPRTPRIWGLFGDIDEMNAICSTEFQVVKPKEDKWYGFIYCFLKSYQVTQELTGAASGTSGSHQRVNPQDIFNLALQKPPDILVKEFDNFTKDIFQKIKSNTIQIQTLTKLRDTLLPKLMSGEVRVKI